MRRITAISLLALTVAALPAQAQGLRSAERPTLQRAVVRSACAGSFADPRCASYQRRMIASAGATSVRTLSVEEAGKRQLDALLRTID